MKVFDINYQLATDVDWFLVDETNTIAHFTSGGGILPEIVAANAQETFLIKDFLRSLSFDGAVNINPTLNAYWPSITDANLNDYKIFASKGVLSFDKTFESHPGDITYHLVANPYTFLNVEELSDTIKMALDKMRVKFGLRDFHKIDVGYIPWASLFEDYEIKPLYDPPAKKKKIFWW
jgi:hypothetical protein